MMSYKIEKLIANIRFFLLRRIPKRVLYWCVIQAWALASTSRYSNKQPDEVTFFMMLEFLHNKEEA